MAEEVAERMARLDLPFNAHGLDPYGISKERLTAIGATLGHLYRHYFHVECRGVQHVPPRGRAMLVANHSGGYAVDASMLAAACFFELEPPRLAHGMVEKFISKMPFFGDWASRLGQFTGLPQHARRLLLDDRLLMVFPEGTRGTAKLFKERHSLVRFGTGFIRLALETKSPIIPVAILGGGEAIPTIKNARLLGKLIGVPYVPITPYVLALPLPARVLICFGEPLRFEGTGQESDREILQMVEATRSAIGELITDAKKDYKPI